MLKKVISLCSLIATDLIVILISFYIAFVIRSEILPRIITQYEWTRLIPFTYFLERYYMALLWIFIFAYQKLYIKRYSFWYEVKILVRSATFSSAIIMIFIFLMKKQLRISRFIIILAWLISLFLFPLFRYLIKLLLVRFNLWRKKLIIIGVHQTSLGILENIEKSFLSVGNMYR